MIQGLELVPIESQAKCKVPSSFLNVNQIIELRRIIQTTIKSLIWNEN